MTCTTPRVAAMSARSPAKINLVLDILGRRDDERVDVRPAAAGIRGGVCPRRVYRPDQNQATEQERAKNKTHS